ncbi:hypothetical protein T492DRAFT_863582 [Pavlovales sp. CCMP2436]|nr:hypothetical protein T492DRAFT_863582 [Pavlovales sp. CCMP2436]
MRDARSSARRWSSSWSRDAHMRVGELAGLRGALVGELAARASGLRAGLRGALIGELATRASGLRAGLRGALVGELAARAGSPRTVSGLRVAETVSRAADKCAGAIVQSIEVLVDNQLALKTMRLAPLLVDFPASTTACTRALAASSTAAAARVTRVLGGEGFVAHAFECGTYGLRKFDSETCLRLTLNSSYAGTTLRPAGQRP